MRKVRVLHITPSVRLLGARQSLLTLVSHLAGSRFEPLVLVPGQGGLTEQLDSRHLPHISLKLPPWRKAGYWPLLPGRVARLREIIRRENIGLVHCNEIYSNPHAVVACSRSPVPTALLSRTLNGRLLHGLGVPVVTHMRLSVTPRMVRNYYLQDATRIICVSNGAAEDFDSFDWKSRTVRVVYNGIDVDRFAAARDQRHLTRSNVGFSDSDFVIGQIGLMMPRKRPMFLLDAALEILNIVPNARFLFVGDSSPGQESYLETLKSRAQESRIGYAVKFLPFQQNIAPYFGALDLNMLVSDDEGFGRVVIEAAAARVPTVGSNVGGIPELIVPHKTGFVIGERNAPDDSFWGEIPRFIEIVRQLAQNEELRISMGEAAQSHVQEKFSSEQYVRGVMEVFDEALEEVSS